MSTTEQHKVIHRLWLGPRLMPREYERYGDQWKSLNPTWAVIDWRKNIFPFVVRNKPLWDVLLDLKKRDDGRQGIELYVQAADVLGYFLVEYFGGVYVNCDMEPVRALQGLPDKAWASYENYVDGRIVNSAMGAPQAHDPFWSGLLDELPEHYRNHRLEEMVMSTGPGFLTEYAHRNMDQLEVLSVEAFNPIHWKEIPHGKDATGMPYPPESYAVHHWGHKRDGRTNFIEAATQ